jgi:predicted GTPase
MEDKPQQELSEADLQKLRRLSEKYKRESEDKSDKSLWALIGDIHNQELLRWWVSVESVALIPLVTKEANNTYLLHQLISVPEGINSARLRTPWAYVAWAWPSRLLLRMETLKHWPNLPQPAFTREHVLTQQSAKLLEAELQRGIEEHITPYEVRSFLEGIASSFPWGAPLAAWDKQTTEREVASDNIAPASEFSAGPVGQVAVKMRALLREGDHMQAVRTLDRLLSRLEAGTFALAVVGEFGRGKSTLINKLLGNEYLSTSRMPGAALLSRLSYGPEDTLTLKRAGSPSVRIAVNARTCEEVDGHLDGKQLAMAELEISSEWLRTTGLQIFDTPGINSGSTEHCAPTMEVLATADAALMVTSALAPLGLSEREFMAQHIAAHLVPRIAVVVTHLDQIPENERASVINYTAAQLKKWTPAAVLGTTLERAALSSDTPLVFAGIIELKQLLEQWIHDSGHRVLALKQVNDGLSRIANEAVEQLAVRKKALTLSDEERKELREKASITIEKIRLDWEDVKIEFRKREIATGDLMEEGLLRQKADLVDRLSYELRARPEPVVWWKEDLPFRLRQELGRLGRDAQSILERKVTEDFRWLQDRANQIYSNSLTSLSIAVQLPFEVPTEVKGKEQPDLHKSRQYTRLAVGGVTIGAFVLFGPLASAVSLAGGIVSENYFKRQLNAQKQEVSEQLGPVMEQLLRNAARIIRARVETLYGDIGSRLKAEGDEWLEITRRAMLAPAQTANEKASITADEQIVRWKALAAELNALKC